MPLFDQFKTIHSFASHLRTTLQWLAHKKGEKPEMDKTTLRNLNKLVGPVANDAAAQLNIGEFVNNGTINVFHERAMIDSVYHKPVKVIFDDEDIRIQMLIDQPHPFQKYSSLMLMCRR